MLVAKPIETTTHEKVMMFEDKETGLNCVIAVHNTKRGPGLGGTRFWSYPLDDHMINDALALSEAMTYKNAAAELPYGGGKAVVNLNGVEKTEALLKSYAEAVNYMEGKYITAEDVGCKPGDLEVIARHTDFCPKESVLKGTATSSSPATAFGVYVGLAGAIEVYEPSHNKSFSDCSVLVQGVGSVGSILAEMLLKSGAEVFVVDINQENLKAFCANNPKAIPISVDTSNLLRRDTELNKILEVFARNSSKEIRVFSPCALGNVVNSDNVDIIAGLFDIICGAANNPVEKGIEERLGQLGTIFCPDFIVNAGGVISIHHDIVGTDTSHGGALTKVGPDLFKIHPRIVEIVKDNFLNPMQAAMEYAKSRI